MVLTPHIITGAAVATLTPNQPLVGFVLGFASHLVLDMIPHWDYPLVSLKKDDGDRLNDDMSINKNFVKDLLLMSFDGVVGLSVAVAFFVFYLKYSLLVILCGVIGGLLPDFLQFVQMKFKREPFNSFRRFHLWLQPKMDFKEKPFWGIASQVIVIFLVIWLSMRI